MPAFRIFCLTALTDTAMVIPNRVAVSLLPSVATSAVAQMIAATGWLAHTSRAALSGLRKAGYAIDSDKVDGVRTYRAVAPQ